MVSALIFGREVRTLAPFDGGADRYDEASAIIRYVLFQKDEHISMKHGMCYCTGLLRVLCVVLGCWAQDTSYDLEYGEISLWVFPCVACRSPVSRLVSSLRCARLRLHNVLCPFFYIQSSACPTSFRFPPMAREILLWCLLSCLVERCAL